MDDLGLAVIARPSTETRLHRTRTQRTDTLVRFRANNTAPTPESTRPAIAKAEPDIVTAEAEDDRVVVWGSACVSELAFGFSNARSPWPRSRSDWDTWKKASKR